MDSDDYNLNNLTIKINSYSIKPTCDCTPQENPKKISFFKKLFKKVTESRQESPYCNHIKWFGINYMKHPYPEMWFYSHMELFYDRYVDRYKYSQHGKNDECYICLEPILYNTQTTIHCCKCNLSVHRACMNKYLAMNDMYFSKKVCCICNHNQRHNTTI
jgi:hypothetical protein